MTAGALPEESGAAGSQPATWKRNLAALWFAEFTAIFGFSFAFPFLPLFIRDLGIHDPGRLAFWTGAAGGASGLALAFTSPLWGVLADRYGRKSMLVRAMLGGAITVGLMGFARGPLDLVVLRLLQGASSGTVAAATALVAGGTPRHRVGWALGVLSSSIAVGSALGPLIGGVAATAFGVRAIWWGGGALLFVAAIPVAVIVREAPRRREAAVSSSALQQLRAAAPGAVAAVGALIACQALVQTAYSGFQPLIVLRLIQIVSAGATTATGVAFATSGLASAVAAVLYSSLARRWGYRPVAMGCAALMAVAQLAAAFGPGVAAVVVGAGFVGAFYGAVGPAVSTMIGLETPSAVQARVFGVSSSATAVGFALGPFGGGLLASAWGPSRAILLTAATAVMLVGLLGLRTREPAR